MKKSQIKVPCSQVYLDDEIREKVLAVLNSGKYILNDNCRKFEEEFANFIGRRYAALVNSATSAIQLSLMALGVESGDEIIVPSLTAFPTVEPIFHVGAKPVFIDINDEYLIDHELIEEKINKKTKGIIPVHLYGNSAKMDKILSLAEKYDLFVLEDASQAHGAEFRGQKVGSFGNVGCFSFYPSKNLTFCGDGGIMVTNDEKLVEKVKMLRDHGRKDKYLHELIGFNMRANEIQAAFGLIQLKHLPEFTIRRREAAQLYNQLLKNLSIKLPTESDHVHHVYHLYVIQLDNRDKVVQFLKEKDICTGIHYPVPCHLQPAVVEIMGKVSLPKTEEYCRNILSLPIFPSITNEQINNVAEQLIQAIKQ